jgi:hypothetical protein
VKNELNLLVGRSAFYEKVATSPQNISRPDRSRGSLGNGLPLEGFLTLGGQLSIDFFDYFSIRPGST